MIMKFFHALAFFAVALTTCNAQGIYSSKQSYLDSITKGQEFNCMKNCVPPERKRYVDENYFFGEDPRPTFACDAKNERPVDGPMCRMSTGLVSNLTYLAGGMYLFPNLTTPIKMNWYAAVKFCRSLNIGLQLASIMNERENNAIGKWLSEQKGPAATNIAKDSFWTTGTNLADELLWLEAGERMHYTNWAGGKQATTSGKICVQITLDKGKIVWKDVECTVDNRVICEVSDECYKNICEG